MSGNGAEPPFAVANERPLTSRMAPVKLSDGFLVDGGLRPNGKPKRSPVPEESLHCLI
jgi:hypothetical protein